MKKRTLLLSMVFVFALVAIVNSTAIAQDQSIHPQMYQNLNDMSEILKDISFQLSTGKMIPEAQKAAGKIMQRMSQNLQELARLGDGMHYIHQKHIREMKKSWNYETSADFEDH
jgi:hypothetical protein